MECHSSEAESQQGATHYVAGDPVDVLKGGERGWPAVILDLQAIPERLYNLRRVMAGPVVDDGHDVLSSRQPLIQQSREAFGQEACAVAGRYVNCKVGSGHAQWLPIVWS